MIVGKIYRTSVIGGLKAVSVIGKPIITTIIGKIKRAYQVVTSLWILKTGVWNDSGLWDDSAYWKDS